jgi:hypothetical protein
MNLCLFEKQKYKAAISAKRRVDFPQTRQGEKVYGNLMDWRLCRVSWFEFAIAELLLVCGSRMKG